MRSAGIGLLGALITSGCVVLEGEERPEESSEPVLEALTVDPGEAALTTWGVAVAATPGALDQPLRVEVGVREGPTVDAPLPRSVEPQGELVTVRIDGSLTTSPQTPLVVGLPLPDGTEPRTLAIAVLDPRAAITPPDDDVDLPAGAVSPDWAYVPATFDLEEGLAFAPILALDEAGLELQLVSAAAFVAEEAGRPAPSGQLVVDDSVSYSTVCGPGFDDPTATETCRQSDLDAATQELQNAYEDATQIGFTETPHLLRRSRIDIERRPGLPAPFRVTVVLGPYEIELRPDSQSDAGGMFSSGSGHVWVAIGDAGFDDGDRRTVRHEYLHATQYGYSPDFTAPYTWLASRWSIEGQAVIGQQSFDTLSRDTRRTVRSVEEDLARSRWTGNSWAPLPSSEYDAQDFWAFVAAANAETDLSFLIPFMREGQSAPAVDAVLRREYPAFAPDGLAGVYFDWARNQTFEAFVDIGDDAFGGPALGAPCTRTSAAAPNVEVLTYSGIDEPTTTLTLPPLSSRVVRFDVDAPADGFVTADLIAPNLDPDIEAKIYDPADAGTQDCWSDPAVGFETLFLQPGDSAQRFALVSNTSLSQTRTVGVTIEGAANVTVDSDVTLFQDGQDVTFTAIVTGLPDAATVPVTWTVEDSDGTETVVGTTRSGEPLVVAPSCDTLGLLVFAEIDLPDGATASGVTAITCVPPTSTAFLNANRGRGGVVTSDGRVFAGDVLDVLDVGDDASNNGVNAFLHFDIGSLPESLVGIAEARLTLTFDGGSVPQNAAELNAVHVDYGTLGSTDYRTEGGSSFLPGFARFSTLSPGIHSVDVTTAVRDAWANRTSRGYQTQFLLYFDPATDSDGVEDLWGIEHQDLPGTTLVPALEITWDNF